MKKWMTGAAMAVALIGFTSQAGATALTVPNTVTAFDAFSGAPGALVGTTGVLNFTSNLGTSDYSGSVIENVYQDSGTGFLDFVYQFYSNPGSGSSIEHMVDSSFTGFTTDVYVDTTTAFGTFSTPGVAPTDAGRTVASNVTWSILLPANEYSAIVMIKTNANGTVPGSISFQNSGVAGVAGLAPAAVPEPMTFSLMGAGLLGLGLLRKRISRS